ncbi:hypothetical protein A8924_1807 [Saccharopolyspora erythraea NRRL 2338]|uniref:Uncharacterized protein n=2 Tax=Saccharopolyspora erythraea TaxID=1836 RepID=A4F9K8_SACEN|nr:VC0807 family protein [Saccharopolyspora erythraea]EQD87386.1 hypothetical protein N599_04670 [Saccharopolyspora erythraea D]PFG94519.1 hypothetical protein A8924_1807 [Saccharopolyspora erythraea NRRL 2338]QRK91270.1 hypothetical protein JQX30_07605 [Saccharopolyspora erythraea]CAM00733.1 hypothetical protein SACE_1411 [Saccharopolyspora erythraea NRRL 2338]
MKLLVTALADLLLPLVVYYGLRSAGAGEVPALLACALISLVRVGYGIVARRSADPVAVFVLAIVLVSLALFLVSGSPRALLARDGWLMAACGAGALATLWRRPVVFTLGRMLVARSGHSAADWDDRWRRSAEFRRVWRVLTVAWGVALLACAGAKVVMAYTVPVDVVPAVTTATWLAAVVLLNVGSQVYLRRPVIKRVVG